MTTTLENLRRVNAWLTEHAAELDTLGEPAAIDVSAYQFTLYWRAHTIEVAREFAEAFRLSEWEPVGEHVRANVDDASWIVLWVDGWDPADLAGVAS